MLGRQQQPVKEHTAAFDWRVQDVLLRSVPISTMESCMMIMHITNMLQCNAHAATHKLQHGGAAALHSAYSSIEQAYNRC